MTEGIFILRLVKLPIKKINGSHDIHGPNERSSNKRSDKS